ncbi:hypothetical protein HK098_006634 [Nowakowskiella sp. JEL0407]|nr:hypothetical protein HK098_006634 [Nowakowskiella sp. JEL0407]
MLDSQTSSISKTSSQYSEYQSTLKKSSTVVSYLINKDLRDRILIFAGFIFFLLVVFNIFRRRLWGDKVSVVVSAETPLHTQEIQTPDDPIGTGTMVVPNADEQIVVDFVTGAVEDAWNTFWENADEVVGTLHGEEL